MVVRSTTNHALAERARKAGWKVSNPKNLGGAYRVAMDRGRCAAEGCAHVIQIHLSSSDVNAEKTILREMTKHGLIAAENRGERRRQAERQATLEAGRAEAERKAAALLKRAKAVNRATGPYAGPELMPDEWYLSPHPAPTFKWVIMTPEQARRIVETINTNNRPRDAEQEEHVAGIILSNQWKMTHQGGAIDEDGVLQDGQNRLWGIVRANVAVPMAWFCGMPRDNFKAIDEGKVRTAAQLFGRDGEDYTTTMQGLIKLILALKGDNPKREWRRKRTNQEIYDSLGLDAEELRLAAKFAGRNTKKAEAFPVGFAGAYYMIRKANGPDNPYVEAFFRGYIRGRKSADVGLHPDDPRLRLREYFNNLRRAKKRISVVGAYATTVRAWNYVISGKKVENMRWADNSTIPRVDVAVVDGRGAVYSCPELLRGEVVDAPAADAPAADAGPSFPVAA